ncbi:hypothetical protein QBC37DRAFT_202616 [Rhypophila decipiens]|uniref:Rhodopsin domain-containing protein n=1 Tax=Rhypophila decipiens TaxID=261697 RepID=A0AAN7B442_9PEZI|nr:hypothetical protein QBC37DRAFT_202616 [Rhypophila decipiens]
MDLNTSVPNRGPQLFAVNTVGIILSGITCILRCIVRTRVVKGFGLDDWLMAIATVFYLIFCTCSNIGISHGTGRHKADLTPEQYTRSMNLWFFCYLSYACSMIAVKLSIGCFLLRVTITRLHKWIIYFSAAITCVSCLTFFFLALFQCNPISYFWTRNQDLDGTQGGCINAGVLVAMAYLYSVMSVITDLSFALLPAWVVGQLNMGKKAKFAVMGLMGMGVIASLAVIARAPYLKHMDSDDFLWDTAPMAIWSSVENGLAITAGCLATLQPLVKGIAIKLGIITPRTTSGTTPMDGRGSNLKMSGVSVRRSFTRTAEVFTGNNYLREPRLSHGELKLQPGLSEYTAKCYGNTSEEELRPVGRMDTETDSGTGASVGGGRSSKERGDDSTSATRVKPREIS